MAAAVIEELHEGSLDVASRKRLELLTYDALVEMGSALPPDLLDELARLVPPGRDATSTEAELRVVWAQILGWINGVVLADDLDDRRATIETMLLQQSALAAAPRPPDRITGPYL